MRTRVALLTKHPVTAYFALAFAISWGGVILAVGPGGFPGTPEQFEILLQVVVLAMLAGPAIAGLLLSGLVDGRPGLTEFRSRLLGIFEECGWTGFAIPRRRLRYGVLATGGLSMALYLPVMLFSFLPPYRLLMVWVYGRTGSLLGAMLRSAVAGVAAADRRVVP